MNRAELRKLIREEIDKTIVSESNERIGKKKYWRVGVDKLASATFFVEAIDQEEAERLAKVEAEDYDYSESLDQELTIGFSETIDYDEYMEMIGEGDEGDDW
jgi:hypothetical protein